MAEGGGERTPIRVFYCYSRKDKELRDALWEHLTPLRDFGIIEDWWDGEIVPGEPWEGRISERLSTADIVLALVSPSFLASRYVMLTEIPRALDRHRQGEARVIPVILRHCGWAITPLQELQALPREAKPVKSWADADEALYDVFLGIQRTVDDLCAARTGSRPASALAQPTPEQTVEPVLKPPLPPAAEPNPAHPPKTSRKKQPTKPLKPEMVAITPGRGAFPRSFMMGSDRHDEEKPRHAVTFGYDFAVGKFPVTFDEYARFCAATQCEPPDDMGWGRGRMPVINVSWEDAQDYLTWLSETTGEPYRLLSEAEWEYCCRAGSDTVYAWGDDRDVTKANLDEKVGRTTKVGSYDPNAWGLFDMHGNVWEWVEDAWHDNYEGAPTDGSVWIDGGDRALRVVRGGCWIDGAMLAHSACRGANRPGGEDGAQGFRICLRSGEGRSPE